MKRITAFLLTAALLFSSVLAVPPAEGAQAEAAESTEYVSLPVTIRDYASDGMLFQWNELGATGDAAGQTENRYSYYAVNPGSWGANNSMGIRILTTRNLPGSSVYWHCIICRSDGSIVQALPSGTAKTNYSSLMQSAAYSVWVYSGDNEYYSVLSKITESNKANYNLTYDQSTGQLIIKSGVFHHGDTKGFGLLQTDASDHFNDLNGDIPGTTKIQNGGWGDSSVSSSTTTLNSGALQTLYGCLVRTNLVEPNLDENKKPVYTEPVVSYLANYLSKTLPEVWENADGSHNMWYVMGTKLFNDANQYVGPGSSATKDLASVLRSTITDGLGSYADTKAEIPQQAADCSTYFDAAYFLLHNTFADKEGYGQTVSEYNAINLVKKTVDGKDYYVYNSAYDGTVYDLERGVIYNSQTDKITSRKEAGQGTTEYVRGNLLPESRFDPVGAIGDGNAYYGKNGDQYGDAVNMTETHYYDNTNYNLTLEGHAQFIYYEDDQLYFNFTGDDDVYLYINGVRVLDMGGGHAISKCGINLNDVQDLCGLKDGEVYDFDFYYMERHGTAANFGIETNIKIVDPSMVTEKAAYQDGQNVGYNGFVNPNKAVTYEFKLTNNGDAQIEELTFKDDDIGISLAKDSIQLNSETSLSDLAVWVLNADGSTKQSYAAGELTEDALKELLASGLMIGETIRLYGFSYTIPEDRWIGSRFPNTVYTTAVSIGENSSRRTLNGAASCQVQKQEYQFAPMHYYEWTGRGVTALKSELIQPVLDAVPNSGITAETAEIRLCTASGNISDAGINPNAEVTAEGIRYTGETTGSDTFYYKVGNYGPVAVTVYSYDVADNTYVLDYSLPVELNGDEFGLCVNDTLRLDDNPYPTTSGIVSLSEASSEYGEFSWNAPSLKYTLNSFMNGTDEATVTVQVLEDGADEVTSRTGVVMTEKITAAPASVVYYEDDFPGITYISEGENGWAYYESNGHTGKEEQSADQEMAYGSDPNYQQDKDTTYTKFVLDANDLNSYQEGAIDYINGYLNGGDASNGTIHELVVKETADVMSFEFRGTGFEIVSRTTQGQYAVVSVQVSKKNADGSYTVIKQMPVITESKGGDLYQVPVISITGLERAEYKVTLRAAAKSEAERVLYIDGIRIYEPLDEVDEALYYNPQEADASFLEVKELIQQGRAIYADISASGDETQLASGSTLIEDISEMGVLTAVEDVTAYMNLGPNNELYMNGASGTQVLAFFLYPEDSVPEENRTIEIGAHRKTDSMWGANRTVQLAYGSTADDVLNDKNEYQVASGTEQYYKIETDKLIKDEANNRYLVLIGTNYSENDGEVLSLTNLKISGYTIGFSEADAVNAVTSGNLEDDPALAELKRIQEALLTEKNQDSEEPAQPDTEVPQIPVNENLKVTGAALKASNVVSGKSAVLTVKCGAEAQAVTVVDSQGTPVEFTKVVSKESGDTKTFQVMWTVNGERGDTLPYCVSAVDSQGCSSANTMEVIVTIK